MSKSSALNFINSSRVSRVWRLITGSNTIGSSRKFWTLFVIAVGLLTIYPALRGTYYASQITLFMSYAFMGLSLALIWGYTGILSFGQAIFFGVSGYAYGLISLNIGGALGSTVGLFGSILIAALSAFIMGYFMFYGGVKDVYATITTLVTTITLHTFMVTTAGDEWTIGTVPLGGSNGIPSIPNLNIGVGEASIVLNDIALYYTVLIFLIITYFALRILVNSNFGYAMVALREDQNRTQLFGYDNKRIKLIVFTMSGALAGIGGTLYAAWGNFVDPGLFGIVFTTLPVIWVSFGGRETLIGAIFGAGLIQWFQQRLAVTGSEWAIVAVGALLVAVIMIFPEGAIPRIRDIVIRKKGQNKAKSLYQKFSNFGESDEEEEEEVLTK